MAALTKAIARPSELIAGEREKSLPGVPSFRWLTMRKSPNGPALNPDRTGAAATATMTWKFAGSPESEGFWAVNAVRTHGLTCCGGAHSVPAADGTTRTSGSAAPAVSAGGTAAVAVAAGDDLGRAGVDGAQEHAAAARRRGWRHRR